MKIVMLLANPFRPDPRVAREAKALVECGHEVTIVAWDREAGGEYPSQETRDGYVIERVRNVRTSYGAGIRQVLYTPRFWRDALFKAQAFIPDVVHCHDLDTLPAGWFLKRKMRVPLIYDAHEDYPALMSLYLPKLMVAILSLGEKYFLREVDTSITASSLLADKFRKGGVERVFTIGNYQSLGEYDQLTNEELDAVRQDLNIKQGKFILTYLGTFSRNRELLPLIEAVRNDDNVELLIWGDGYQRKEVEEAAKQVPNARYLGWASPDKVPAYFSISDVIFYCLKVDYPGAIYNAPNTLSNAMAAGRPVIANDVGDLGRIVHQTGCGLLISDVTPETIREAISRLKHKRIREQLGKAGRKAAEQQYNWDFASKSLMNIYQQILDKDWMSRS